MSIYRCCDDLRREAVAAQTARNGIDYLEVVDHDEPDPTKRQRVLLVHFVNQPHPAVTEANVVIDGGERVRNIVVKSVTFAGDVLQVEVDPRGDFSPYVLRLMETDHKTLLATLDPQLAEVEFSFKVECASDFDCRPETICLAPASEPPRIDYLAKDYESFRQLMLDRMALLVPEWRERSAADLGIALVELLAYVGDHLSYQQDAIATEAYLGTARQRISVRRHARLVDYQMHDGCNARVFVHIEVTAVSLTLAGHTPLLTHLDRVDKRLVPNSSALDDAFNAGPTVFETMHDVVLMQDHNRMFFYTWNRRNCCLPRGATSATLRDAHPGLKKGDLLVFEEVIGPQSGDPADADPGHRHVVRLTADANVTEDPVRKTPATPIPITEIQWADADALPFPLCITVTTPGDENHPSLYIEDVSVVVGNIVLADHGRTFAGDALGQMPAPEIFIPAAAGDPCDRSGDIAVPARFRPQLPRGPLTQQGRIAAPSPDEPDPRTFDPAAPASSAMHWDMALVLPRVGLTATLGTATLPPWEVRTDLFSSEPTSMHFVAEVDDNGIAIIRFGDDDYGAMPLEETLFKATYRAGNGTAGNVGAEAIAHIVSNDSGVTSVRNPMPARGGVDPEPIEHARQAAPDAFRVQERAVTESDYAEVTQGREGVDHAAATFRWTGSWYTLFDTVDRKGGLEVDDAYRADTRAYLEHYRVVGNDLEVDMPRFVPADVAMVVCVKPSFFRADVERELFDVFGNGVRRDGGLGFFHPDNFTFGQSLYLSRIYAAAQAVQGVDSVNIIRFQRQGNASSSVLDTGELTMARLEIVQLENSRDFPERGRLELQMRGGR
ncbi:MAG TPA: putative baseplate assembly protein [Thermoanaerobaculia bacterium]|nr:putative baseplate assembly protein [Thermoanaerobaculia bacterium]